MQDGTMSLSMLECDVGGLIGALKYSTFNTHTTILSLLDWLLENADIPPFLHHGGKTT